MNLINLASGASFFNTPEVGRQAAIKALNNHKTFYGLAEGTLGLRKAIGQRYQEMNKVSINPSNILITPGVKHALFNVLYQIIASGDEIIIPAPNWFGLKQIIEQFQAVPVLLPTTPIDNYTISPALLEQHITSKTRVFLFSNPCNPSGRLYTSLEIEGILSVLQHYPDIYFLSDEIYDLVTYGKQVPSLIQFPDPFNKHLVVNGFSKSFAMAGWRLGYIIGSSDLIQKCQAFQFSSFGGVSEFVQDAAQAVLENQESILKHFNSLLHQNREFMGNFLSNLSIPHFKPDGAYYYFPNLSKFLTKKIPTTLALAQYLKDFYNLEIFPGENFGAPGFARLSFALEPHLLEEALKRLNTAFKFSPENLLYRTC